MRGEACSMISLPPAGAMRGDFCGDNRDQKPPSGCRDDAFGTTPALGDARCRAAPIGSTRVGCRGEALGDVQQEVGLVDVRRLLGVQPAMQDVDQTKEPLELRNDEPRRPMHRDLRIRDVADGADDHLRDGRASMASWRRGVVTMRDDSRRCRRAEAQKDAESRAALPLNRSQSGADRIRHLKAPP